MRWEGHVVQIGEMRNAYSILVGKPEGKRPVGKPWRKRDNNIRMDLKKIEWEIVAGIIWFRVMTSGGLL
jgi:hypothetical protein